MEHNINNGNGRIRDVIFLEISSLVQFMDTLKIDIKLSMHQILSIELSLSRCEYQIVVIHQ